MSSFPARMASIWQHAARKEDMATTVEPADVAACGRKSSATAGFRAKRFTFPGVTIKERVRWPC